MVIIQVFTMLSNMISISLSLLRLLNQSVVKSEESNKLFQRVTSSHGSAVCAVDKPSQLVSVDPEVVNSFCVPPDVRCAWQCARRPNCTGYNYKAVLPKCEIYPFSPTNIISTDSSYNYFQVKYVPTYVNNKTTTFGETPFLRPS